MKKNYLLVLLFLIGFCSSAIAQDRKVSGKVTSATDGMGFPGVNVVLKGTTNGAVTDLDGNYSINVPANGGTLEFSAVGFTTQAVNIGNQSVINVSLAEDVQQLSEVVIQVPYGTIKKTSFTGSESTVGTRDISRQQVTSVTKALEGLVPGVIATNGGGQPGSNAAIRIRGIGSVNASSSPLYVLDGVPYDGDLSAISPDEVGSVTVLKDAAAAALYGSRAANGVIMITTKRGKKDKTLVTANVRTGLMNRGIPEYDRVNSQEYMEVMWEAMRNRTLTANNPATKQRYTREEANQYASDNITGKNGLVYNPYKVPEGQAVIDPATGKLNPNAALLWEDSWEKALYRNAIRKDMNFNVSGGGNKNDYFLSMGYLNEEGIVRNSGFDRINTRLNVNSQMTDWLKGGLNLAGSLTNQSGFVTTSTATSNPFYYSRMMGPIYPVYQRDANGNYVPDPINGGNQLDWGIPSQMGSRPYAGNSNLVGSLALDDRSNRALNVTSNAFLEAVFLKDFAFRTTLGVNSYNRARTTYQNSQFGDAANVSGRSTKDSYNVLSYTFNQVLSYNKQIGAHNVRALVGHENYDYTNNFVTATRSGFPFPGTSELAAAATAEASNSYTNYDRIESYFASVNYSLQDKYLLSGSFRTDGSSRFSPVDNLRWGNFWSLGTGWRISEEAFLKDNEYINELKLKASYGEQGNNGLLLTDGSPDFYAWQSTYALGWNNVNSPGATFGTLANPALQWETNKTFNAGFDFRLFNKFEGSIEYFNRISDDLLFKVPLPTSIGIAGGVNSNIGTLVNRGIELQLGYNAISSKKFDWRVDLNLTSFKNVFTKLPQEEIIDGTKKYMVGKSIYDFWIREYAGVDPATGDALYYKNVKDAEGKPTGERTTVNNINQGDFYYHGSAIPKLIGGFINSFRYGNFDLAIQTNFQLGGKFYDGNYAALMHPGRYGSHWHKDILNRWQQPGDVTDVPRVQNNVANQAGVSSRFLFDASYLSIRNINLGYKIPASVSKIAGIAGSRVFVSVDNAQLFTTRKGMDPQRSFNGVSDFSYVPTRTFSAGLSVNF